MNCKFCLSNKVSCIKSIKSTSNLYIQMSFENALNSKESFLRITKSKTIDKSDKQPDDIGKFIKKYKVLNENQYNKLKNYFNSNLIFKHKNSYSKIAKEIGISSEQILGYVKKHVKKKINFINEFYSTAESIIRKIQIENEQTTKRYKEEDKNFKEKLLNKYKISDN